jgi:hypothetical protein
MVPIVTENSYTGHNWLRRMAEIEIDFRWSRDAKGYSLNRGPRLPPMPGSIVHPIGIRLLSKRCPEDRWRIVGNGGRAIVSEPLRQYRDLWQVFASSVKDAKSALEFVQNYGPLTQDGRNRRIGDHLQTVLTHAEAMRRLAEILTHMESPKRKAGSVTLKENGLPISTVDVSLVRDPVTKHQRLAFSPETMLEGLWLQYAQFVTGDHPIRSCLHCGELFSVGAGTGRRLDAQFCKEEHKIRFHSLNRSRK